MWGITGPAAPRAVTKMTVTKKNSPPQAFFRLTTVHIVELGRRIRLWMQEHNIEPFDRIAPVIWPLQAPEVSETRLPKTSATYEIPISLAPEVYMFILNIQSPLEETVSRDVWADVVRTVRARPQCLWQIEGDGAFVQTGRITHLPLGSPNEWSSMARICVGITEIGEPILIRHVRKISMLSPK
jgi:hypothetical protein